MSQPTTFRSRSGNAGPAGARVSGCGKNPPALIGLDIGTPGMPGPHGRHAWDLRRIT